MKEVSEVLNATARLLNAAADAIEKATNPLLAATVKTDIAAAPAPAAPSKGPGRPKKAVAPAETAPTPAAPAPAAAPERQATTPPTILAAEDSLKEIRAVAKVYVQRYGNQADGLAAFRKIMSDKTGAGKIDDLKHEQRLVVIEAVKAELAKADSMLKSAAPAAPAAGSGVEV